MPRTNAVHANSRDAASFYFDLPGADETFRARVGQDPTNAIKEVSQYMGARAYAKANGIDFPGVVQTRL